MYLEYLKERYNDYDFYPLTLEQIAKRFESLQEELGNEIIKKPEGFMTYKLEGDAVLINDFYVKPQYRGHTKAWEFHDEVIDIARKAGKKVAVTFAELLGKNHLKGIGAIRTAGFIPAFKTTSDIVFIKGI